MTDPDGALSTPALPEASAAWRPAWRAVERSAFIPDRMWVDEGGDEAVDCVPIDRLSDPSRWLDAVNSDRVVVTQFDDGRTRWPDVGDRPSCSSSMPSAMASMLEALDLRDDDAVLEIGTGTGFNAAILAQRAASVVTVELDPGIAAVASHALSAVPNVEVVCADGARGVDDRGPFDRILATASVRWGQFPIEWLRQARPGAVVVCPVRTDLTAGPLVRFEVDENHDAHGVVLPDRVHFMELRSHRYPVGWPGLHWDDEQADLIHTEIEPWSALLAEASRWAIGVAVPQCRFEVWERAETRPHGVAWLVDTCSGSWASVVPGNVDDVFDVRQVGPRRLWDQAEAALRSWRSHGSPGVEDWRFEIVYGYQRAVPTATRDARVSA